ncbi:hypothetical protein CS022_07980 [Veronia nyctiphanis]|uniref:Uncharacterized protein n=1 Tax=Veronia nyctiphanis TaxID=1278244 RepID=A0A4Q0YRD9_9GAMM|nr:hypothetical protein CS022_07980 [Veronia nyctiphanis]
MTRNLPLFLLRELPSLPLVAVTAKFIWVSCESLQRIFFKPVLIAQAFFLPENKALLSELLPIVQRLNYKTVVSYSFSYTRDITHASV